MNRFTTPDFWPLYKALPRVVRDLADKNFEVLKAHSAHPSLHFKEIEADIWSVRVGRHYRALAVKEDDGYYWYWIGSHADYDKLIP